jgi:hypothetical protein
MFSFELDCGQVSQRYMFDHIVETNASLQLLVCYGLRVCAVLFLEEVSAVLMNAHMTGPPRTSATEKPPIENS